MDSLREDFEKAKTQNTELEKRMYEYICNWICVYSLLCIVNIWKEEKKAQRKLVRSS